MHRETIPLGLAVAALVAIFCYQIAYGTSEPILSWPIRDNDTYAYKLGFTDGYLGIKVPGPHTQQYLMGYANGTESLESNRGSVAADNAIPLSPGHTQDYIGGYQQSMYFRSPNQSSDHSLPAHTNDNYTHFYIGYHDGAVAEDNYNSHNGPYKSTCADGHTHEYCAGYKAGFIAEEDANS